MINNESYADAYTEVLTVLDSVKEGYGNIPEEIIDNFKENCNPDYIFELKAGIPLKEQKLLETTKAILAVIARDYWATPEQKQIILQYERNEYIKSENDKKENFQEKELFSKDRINKEKKDKNTELVVYKENLFIKILNKIKSFCRGD